MNLKYYRVHVKTVTPVTFQFLFGNLQSFGSSLDALYFF